MIGMAVADQRVLERRAKAPTECGELGGAELLVAEHQHRMFGEGLLDPGEGCVIEPGQIHPDRLGAERVPKWAQLRCIRHWRSSHRADVAAPAVSLGQPGRTKMTHYDLDRAIAAIGSAHRRVPHVTDCGRGRRSVS
jgi:hypothetical protein